MHGLQTIADVRQSAPDNHAHGVIEIRPAHLVFDIDRDYILPAFAPEWHLRTAAGRCWRDVRVFRIRQKLTPWKYRARVPRNDAIDSLHFSKSARRYKGVTKEFQCAEA